jgi:hypothetical protein
MEERAKTNDTIFLHARSRVKSLWRERSLPSATTPRTTSTQNNAVPMPIIVVFFCFCCPSPSEISIDQAVVNNWCMHFHFI